ncbi:WecB/TagA/CpsF family glycosyltransferase [Hufsiella ginkgonis]|uniref:WecB/TagA/CpsF family glycosyltransferase n=1 Tax=Hufsiella ginkgonis TaxID=2695274 RepID=A0A7K1XZ10_9SPHI|nr:WecB/TagA/CpsF family glycosyltransferase [Hufsiella ginkgonis]MXV15796.1 WecB/TagA/CpsF family glycosyltransferase [Hufsiella ginkgonis]
MNNQRKNFLDYSVFTKTLNNLPSGKTLLVNTINQYSYCIAQANSIFKKSLQHSDILLPDGIGIVMAIRFLTGKVIKKIAGTDVHEHMLRRLNDRSGSCFYLGSTNDTLAKITSKLSAEFPNIQVGSYAPPYKTTFNSHDDAGMIRAVNTFKPDVLFVGMTAPKQEIWVHLHKEKLDTRIICTIGAVFDFYAGTLTRPGKVWISLGLEWFIRLIKEPRRLSMRYLYFGPQFIWLILKEKYLQLSSGKKVPARNKIIYRAD